MTYDAWHYIERVTGHELRLTNSDSPRSYAGIYLHENRLCILDATAGRDEAPPIIFQQSFGFLDAEGEPSVSRLLLQSSSPPRLKRP